MALIAFCWAGSATVALYFSYTDLGLTTSEALMYTVGAPITAAMRLVKSVIELFKKPIA